MSVVKSTKSIIRKNSAGSDFIHRRINLIEGSGITLTVADDATNNETDVTIAGAASGANTALSNLAAVAINTTLVSDTDVTDDLGTFAIAWRKLYIGGANTTSASGIQFGNSGTFGNNSYLYRTGVSVLTLIAGGGFKIREDSTANSTLTMLPQPGTNPFYIEGPVGGGFKIKLYGHWYPNNDSTFDLGSTTLAWANLYVDTISSITGNPLALTPISGQSLTVNLATTGDFLVNTNQLTVDTSAGFVGIGTATPNTTLDVVGFIEWSGQTRVSTQFDKTNDAALATITGLSVTVVAGKTYQFKAKLHVTANVTGGHQYAIAGTATATAIIYQVNSISNTTNLFTINSRQTALGGAVGQAGATTTYTEITGVITVNAGGTLLVQFAQNVATPATTSSVLVGSTFIVEQIN